MEHKDTLCVHQEDRSDQTEFFKVRPGLWALRDFQARLHLDEYDEHEAAAPDQAEKTHSYYQGLLVEIGNFRKHPTYVPNQDQNKLFVNRSLGDIRSLKDLPKFSYDNLVKSSSTIDVIWFNERNMPHSFFEVEHSTDMQNSLVKFCGLQDFYTRMVIVAHETRREEFMSKRIKTAFREINERVSFCNYKMLERDYERELERRAAPASFQL